MFLLVCLTGCGNKNMISKDDFITKAENNDLVVTDATNQYSSYGYITSATIAQHSDGWQIEFYVLDDAANAQSMFNTNKTNFENSKGGTATETSASMGNYSTYGLTSNGYYMYVSRVDNTLLYVRVKDTYKDKVKDVIKDLGY